MATPIALKLNRLVLAITITFLIADTCPHPNLSPGLMERALASIVHPSSGTPQ